MRKIKILTTGAEGMMGSDVVPALENHFEIRGTDLPELDVRNSGQITKHLDDFQPNWVLHMAAMTDLERCEEEPELADAVNHVGSRNVARACREKGTGLIYISTSGIFSGQKKTPYLETDTPKPQNIYGVSKYRGETAVREIMPESDLLVLRAGWLFGGGEKDKKFVGKMYGLARDRDEISAVDDIYGSPNYTLDIAALITYLIGRNDCRGIYHAVNEGWTNRYNIARRIVEYAGFNCRVEPVPASHFPTKAPRPPMEAIVSPRLKKIGYRMRPWEEALEEYIKRLKCELR